MSVRLKFVMRFCSGSRRAAISVTAQSASCQCDWIIKHERSEIAAALKYATDAHTPMLCARFNKEINLNAHSVGRSPLQVMKRMQIECGEGQKQMIR